MRNKGLRLLRHITAKFTSIENEGFNCLARHGYNIKRNFGHGRDGLANLLATLNLFAFALHAVQDCVSDLWRQGRARAGTRRNFFATLGFLTQWFCFRSWTALFETLLIKRPPLPVPCSPPPPPACVPSRPDHPATASLRHARTLADSTPHEPAPLS